MVSQQNSLFVSVSPTSPLSNGEVARRLERGAELLESRAANPFRVKAYRHAAQTIRELAFPLATVAQRLAASQQTTGEAKNDGTFVPFLKRRAESRKRRTSVNRGTFVPKGEWNGGMQEQNDGTFVPKATARPVDSSFEHSEIRKLKHGTFVPKGERTHPDWLVEKLRTLPGIGESMAQTITGLARTGRWELLDELERDSSYAEVFSTVPGIGAELADRIHAQLGIETLPQLAAAAHDGRLSHVPGFGPKRLRSVRESLAGRLHLSAQELRKAAREAAHYPLPDEPPVSELLSIDAQYRRQATAGILPKVAPRRFNPTHAAWLPVLHTLRGNRQYTAMFSNTARAHDLGTTRDWVVIHRSDRHGRGLWTVITSTFGPGKGERVVRGREEEQSQAGGEKSPNKARLKD